MMWDRKMILWFTQTDASISSKEKLFTHSKRQLENMHFAALNFKASMGWLPWIFMRRGISTDSRPVQQTPPHILREKLGHLRGGTMHYRQKQMKRFSLTCKTFLVPNSEIPCHGFKVKVAIGLEWGGHRRKDAFQMNFRSHSSDWGPPLRLDAKHGLTWKAH